MAQFLRPVEDISVGGGSAGEKWSSAPLYEKVDEETYSDADYISSSSYGRRECILGLTSGEEPASRTGHIVRVRAKYTSSGCNWTQVTLYQGSTEIEMKQFTLSSSFQTFSFEVSEANAGNITDYTDLRIGILDDEYQMAVSWVELEIPDAGATGLEMGCNF